MNQTQTLPTGGTVPRGSPSLQELFEAQRLAEQLPVLDAALHRAEQRLRAERSSEGRSNGERPAGAVGRARAGVPCLRVLLRTRRWDKFGF